MRAEERLCVLGELGKAEDVVGEIGGSAVAATVDGDDVVGARELGDDGAEVGGVAEPAMDEDYGDAVAVW